MPAGSDTALRTISPLYSALARVRAWAYQKKIFRVRRLKDATVVSVGNLTVGGTGKTPMVLWLAQCLHEDGKNVAILTRGYRGGTEKPRSPGAAKSAGQGEPQSDEVALLRARLQGRAQLGVGANRFKNGKLLARHGVDWFVLDDGFQHLKLYRDADIVLIDATDPFGAGRTLPAGRLREPISALRRADLVVITKSMDATAPAVEAMVRRYTTSPIFYATYKFDQLLRLPATSLPAGAECMNAPAPAFNEDWRALRVFAFCAIGNPGVFFADLRRWGFQLAGEQRFPDHHVYEASEMAAMEQRALDAGADALLCTEKDVWNLRHVQTKRLPVYCCRISLQLPAEEFLDAMHRAIVRTRIGAAL